VSARRVGQDEALAEAVLAAESPGTVWIGVDGFGGAGKTTFAARIAEAVPRATVVHVDDFARPWIAEWDFDRFGADVVAPLLAGRPARYQRFDWPTETLAEWYELQPGQVIVSEGVSSTRPETGVPWALTVWVEAPRDVRLQRALDRDGPELMPRWLDDWMPSEQAWAARAHPFGWIDLVIPGS
jgi:uridine kinase